MYGELLHVVESLIRLFIPCRCLCCDAYLYDFEKYMCLDCLSNFPYTYFWENKYNPMLYRFMNLCKEENCELIPFNNISALALYYYSADSDYSNINKDLKYRSAISMGRYFSRLLSKFYHESYCFDKSAFVLPIPLHFMRKWKRSYNQSEIIAKEIADNLCMCLVLNLLYRKRYRKSQARVSMEDKLSNMNDVFAVHKERLQDLYKSREISFVIVDDLFTSGATMFSACKALLQACEELKIPKNYIKITIISLSFVRI